MPSDWKTLAIAAALGALAAPAAAQAQLDFDRGLDAAGLLEELRLQPARSVPVAAPAPTPCEGPGAVLGGPLDPSLVALGKELEPKAKAEWQRRLKANGGKAALAPLGRFDPSKKLLVFIPGIGLNFQDAHALAEAGDTYQVVIAVYNQRLTLADNGRQVADALQTLAAYRAALSRARGAEADRELRLLGHSFGGLVGELALKRLVEKGLIHDGPESLFPRVLFLCIDAGWRGFDAPWLFSLPGIKHLAGEVLPRIPLPIKATHSALTVVNRTRSMSSVLDLSLPDNVTVRLVNVPTEGPRKRVEPVDGWYSSELGKGELRRLWDFLRFPSANSDRLDSWKWGALIRQQGLQQLWRTLERDSDFRAHEAALYQAAVRSTTLEEFAARYDAIVAEIVDTFHGQHTQFMWTDPAFMPWLRRTLAGWNAGG